MAFEIVDGMTGTKHISSEDLAALNTATVGKADCVLKYGDDFALTMASANSATLGTGVGMVGGRRFWNQAPTSLTIQSGTQGQKRNDLVVARYEKTSAGIESITPVVIKGTPTTGTPADPEVTANDLKLWRVPLDGINAGTPVRLFEPVIPLATLGDSVSQSAYAKLYKGEDYGSVVFYARGGIATLTVIHVVGVSVGAPLKVPDIIPARFRPDDEFYSTLAHRQSNNIGQIWVPNKTASDPYVYIYAGVEPSGHTNALFGSVSWIYTEPDDLEKIASI